MKRQLSRNPGAVFDAVIFFERSAFDCVGTATAAVYASAVELAPKYDKLASLVDLKLKSFVAAQGGSSSFPEIQCPLKVYGRTREHDSNLAAQLLIIKNYMQLNGRTNMFSVGDQAVASALTPSVRSSAEQVIGKRPFAVKP
jgi:hypothetical protein